MRLFPTRSALASLKACHAREGTLPASSIWKRRWGASGWNCSQRSRPASSGRQLCSIRHGSLQHPQPGIAHRACARARRAQLATRLFPMPARDTGNFHKFRFQRCISTCTLNLISPAIGRSYSRPPYNPSGDKGNRRSPFWGCGQSRRGGLLIGGQTGNLSLV